MEDDEREREEERERLEEEIFALQEKVQAQKQKLEELEKQRKESTRQQISSSNNAKAQRTDAALNEVLEQVAGEVLRACSKYDARDDRDKGEHKGESPAVAPDHLEADGEEERAILQEIVGNLSKSASDLADTLSGRSAKGKHLDAKGAYIDEVITTKSRCLLDAALSLLLMGLLLTIIVLEDVTVMHECLEQVDKVRDEPFLSERGGYITFNNVSNWPDAGNFVLGPLSDFVRKNSTELARNEAIMPLRVRQNRVKMVPMGQDECPDFVGSAGDFLGNGFCFPAYDESTNAAGHFFQGASDIPPISPPAGAEQAFQYVQNPWTPSYRWHYPPEESPDLAPMQGFPSGGYVFIVPIFENGTLDVSVLRDIFFDGPTSWVDSQTRFLGLSLVFYNANYGMFIMAHFSIWLSEQGLFDTAVDLHALKDETPKRRLVLYTLSAVTLLVVTYMAFTLIQYFRVILGHERELSRQHRERKRNSRLAHGLAGASLDKDDLAQATSRGIPVFRVLTRFLFDMWNAIDILIIVCAVLGTSYFILCYESDRFGKLRIPTYSRFVDVSILGRFAELGRLFAAHAVVLLGVKLFKLMPVPAYVFLEFGILYYSLGQVLTLAICGTLLTLAMSIASLLFYAGDLSRESYFLQNFLWWQRIFTGEMSMAIGRRDPTLGISLEISFALFMNLFVIKSVVAICYQARIKVYTKRMQYETDTKTIVLGLTGEIVNHAKQWWSRNKLGQPNY
ncbi:Polycystic kidney disease protein 1-like 2 [Hondaea fermentalgiana]|uniref:Polycystic kidney disease protein 1-like 2 n=1 Tax=Hondaea fermentalgiana TaxID=2315210 RepID=A0A2R5GLZ0_9STRA|nr:Polycystic kidney disease protein 1-like 2 [Hondaea fermentalgiana]|eukprot:GBG31897.1 Polycystic kidney disease protein 1-like 2 [Hondaea fermentalgiana]